MKKRKEGMILQFGSNVSRKVCVLINWKGEYALASD